MNIDQQPGAPGFGGSPRGVQRLAAILATCLVIGIIVAVAFGVLIEDPEADAKERAAREELMVVRKELKAAREEAKRARSIAKAAKEQARAAIADALAGRSVGDDYAVQLPVDVRNQSLVAAKGTLVRVIIDESGAYSLMGQPVLEDELSARLQAEIDKQPGLKVLVQAHKDSRHASVANVLAICRAAGLSEANVALTTAQSETDRTCP